MTLLTSGADPDAERDDGSTPLHAAATFGSDYLTVQALAQAGATLDKVGPGGATPLFWAAQEGNVEVGVHVQHHIPLVAAF